MSEALELYGRIESVDSFGVLLAALVQAFGRSARVWPRDPGFFVILTGSPGRVVGSLEFVDGGWCVRGMKAYAKPFAL